jgi:hypothetical protein
MFFSVSEPKNRIVEQVSQIINRMSPVYGYDINISDHKPKRTTEQNNFYWVNNQDIANFLNEAGVKMAFGIAFTSDDIHRINKKHLGVPSTKKKDIQAFSDYMTQVFAFWIEKTNGVWQPKESPYSYFEKTGLIER